MGVILVSAFIVGVKQLFAHWFKYLFCIRCAETKRLHFLQEFVVSS